MSKELEALKRIKSHYNDRVCIDILEDFDLIETALKETEENKAMLDIFKNALTVERDIPPELEIKESEKGISYVFKEAVKIHENRIEEMFKKSLREWVLKNAFPKELKALEIIKKYVKITNFEFGEYLHATKKLSSIPQEEYDLLIEVLL